MVTEDRVKEIVKKLIEYYASFEISYGEVSYQKLSDDNRGIYQLKAIGWHGKRRIYGLILDLEVKKGLVWIHYDGIEEGIALKLEERGIPKEQIVLGWLSPTMRKLTDYAKV